MKLTTGRNIAAALTIGIVAYTVYKIHTSGMQSISPDNWYIILIDIGLGIVIIAGTSAKIRKARKQEQHTKGETS